MFIIDVPAVPPQETSVVLVQAANTSSQPDYLLKTCDEVPSAGGAVTAMNTVNPAGWLVTQVVQQRSQSITREELHAMMASVSLTQVQTYAHGKLIPHTTGSGRVFYEYRSEPGYVGKDQAIFIAEFEGKRYKIIANVVVSMTINENAPQCPESTLIEITKPSSGDSGFGTGYNLVSVSVSYQPNPAFERDAAKARRPSTLR